MASYANTVEQRTFWVVLQLHQLHDPISITANFPTFTIYQVQKPLRVAANLMIISLELK